jgi:2-polyprenyl-6-methoxyphenol hydroxylase-like FAD-dependent oxidoreductase
LTRIAHHRFHASVQRHYERLTSFPEGFLVIGDALCTFNPVHAQGMSAAAKHARLLGDVLAERLGGPRGLDGLASEFFVRAAELNRTPWDLARLVAEVFHLVRPLSALQEEPLRSRGLARMSTG